MTLAARRGKPVIRKHFERLIAQGKRSKVAMAAMVACMRKLLIYLNHLLANPQKSSPPLDNKHSR